MTDQISVLPLELWAREFKELEPTPGTPELDWCPVMLKAQTSFWQLPSVCKGFCNVFRAHPELGHHILLDTGKLKSRSPQVAASLVPWLEARAAFVKTFHANDWSMDVVKYLRTLQHQSSGLTVIELKTIHNHEVICLSSFTALTSCCLHPSLHHDTLDLRPLQGLQMLTKLALNRGGYSNLSSMSHLTDLDLNRAHIYDSGYSTFASNLIHLKMQKSDLDGLHAWGLMACIALQSFEISEDCTIGAKHWVDCLDTSVSPSGFVRNSADLSPRADFSSLACLTALRLSLRSHGHPLCGLSTLPCLQSLHLVVAGPVDIGPAFERLNKLTNLYVGTVERISFLYKEFVSFLLDWQALLELHQLEIRGLFSAGSSFMNLAKLSCLRCLELEEADPANGETSWYLKSLCSKMMSDHPAVLCRCPRWF
ncbi:TPA: hypothetical protein ACH3X3_008366 [Trebouxia sp. C0006]